jgi:hypothetical protein
VTLVLGWWGRRKKKRRAKLVEKQFGKRADYARGFPCVIEGCNRWPTHAAHVRSRAAGGVAENNIVSLCTVHHTEQHNMGILSFQAKYQIDLHGEAERIEEMFRKEKLGDDDLAF